MQARIPVSTYRLQFNRDFTFAHARALIEYLRELGITDCYSSPVLKARAGSVHGYDIVDHAQINPELGGEAEFVEFARALREREMGLLMDVVPNHMCIASHENGWWQDVLENGPGSPFARYFDVDWNPPNPALKDRVLLPILGDQFGRVLEKQELRVAYRDGAFHLNYWETQLPVASRTSTLILRLALDTSRALLGESHPHVIELESIVTALNNLPARTETDPVRVRERRREKDVVRRRLSELVKGSNEARGAVHEAISRVNGAKGRPESFDPLEELLSEQPYRLSFWRVASDEINYRRFFDINELAAVRVEERPVFTAVHEVAFRFLRQGLITGLRVDHVDGLLDPSKYLSDIQREATAAARRKRDEEPWLGDVQDGARGEEGADAQAPLRFYVVVEKILGHDELLRREWPAHGTSGYDFMNLLGGVFVETTNAQAFHELYAGFTGERVRFSDQLYECKRLILDAAMSSELHVLARRLDRIAAQHRYSRDFTLNSLQHALAEVIACFPVYRSYIRRSQTGVGPDDRLNINAAVRAAARRNPAQDPSIFDFIASLLLLKDPKGIAPAQRAERRDFALRFQQLTSPVTAKGIEDTAFYRFHPLASLNEVGGEPAIFGTPIERFHRRNQDRQETWPHTLSATATHDTKRGEDTRARINTLSEMPEEWNRAVHRWREMNRARKSVVEGAEAPDSNEEYLLYQTLVGTWPLLAMNDDDERGGYVRRVQEYMNKALKEAKLHTSWINPNDAYERAVGEFVASILDPSDGNRFLSDFVEFQRPLARAGMLNSLAQTLLKTTAPGVPDFYQGTELWSFTLVDPDNRRPVDYDLRRALLASMREVGGDATEFVNSLLERPEDGRIKLYVTSRALKFRRARRDLFARGSYLPLRAEGQRADNVVAFARAHDADAGIVIVGRFFTRLGVGTSGALCLSKDVWGDTRLPLGELQDGGCFRDVFTGREFDARDGTLALSEILSPLPVALLERVAG